MGFIAKRGEKMIKETINVVKNDVFKFVALGLGVRVVTSVLSVRFNLMISVSVKPSKEKAIGRQRRLVGADWRYFTSCVSFLFFFSFVLQIRGEEFDVNIAPKTERRITLCISSFESSPLTSSVAIYTKRLGEVLVCTG